MSLALQTSGEGETLEAVPVIRTTRGGNPASVWRYILRRLALIPIGLFLIATGTFALTAFTPSDPARAILGQTAPEPAVAALRHKLGLDRSIPRQYLHYLNHLLHGNLGTSYYQNDAVSHEIRTRLTSSLELIVISIALGLVLGVVVGALGAYFRGTSLDRGTRALVALGQAVPEFVIGLIASYFLFYKLHWLPPPGGQLGITDEPARTVTGAAFVDAVMAGNWSTASAAAIHLILPVLTITVAVAVIFAKTTRTVQAESMDSAYTEFARACGLKERTAVWQAFRTTLPPTLTYLALVVAGSIGGVAIVETLFSWNGVGAWAVTAMLKRDLPEVQAFVLLSGAITFLTYIASDLAIRLIDPRAAQRR